MATANEQAKMKKLLEDNLHCSRFNLIYQWAEFDCEEAAKEFSEQFPFWDVEVSTCLDETETTAVDEIPVATVSS